MIHFHGTPLTPREKLYLLAGRHFCVSFADPRDADVCMQIGQMNLWDNGKFPTYTRGLVIDEAKLHISAESTQRDRGKAPGQNGESAHPFR